MNTNRNNFETSNELFELVLIFLKRKILKLFLLLFLLFPSISFAGFTISGTTATQTGGSSSSRDTPQTLINLGNSNFTLGGFKTIIVANGYDIVIDGFYEDSGWHYEMSDGSTIQKGGNVDWVSGQEFHGYKIKGATFNINNTGSASNFNLANGGNIYWRDVRFETRSNGRSDFKINDDGLTNYDVDGFTFESSLGDTENVDLVFDTGQFKNLRLIRLNLTIGGTGIITNLEHSGLQESGTENKIFPNTDNYHFINYKPYILSDGATLATGFHQIPNNPADGEKTIYFDDLEVPLWWDNTTDIVVHSGPGRILVRRTFDVKLTDSDGASLTGVRALIKNTSDDSESLNNDFNNEINQYLIVYDGLKTGTNSYSTPNIQNDYQNKEAYFYKYDKQINAITGIDMSANSFNRTAVLLDDLNISEPNKAIVDAYTNISNLDQLYDSAKSWKVTPANLEYPTTSTQPINGNGSVLDLGNFNLVIDASAAQAFSLNTSTNTITIRSSKLEAGEKFSSIETSGLVSLNNGAEIEFGYMDSMGTNIFVHLNWNQPITLEVSIENLDNSGIISSSVETTEYKNHFSIPNPIPANGIELSLKNIGETFSIYSETIPTTELNFLRLDIYIPASQNTQSKMLFLARKILQKTETINQSINSTGTIVDVIDQSTITTGTTATSENQTAIINLLNRILLKSSAIRGSFD